MNKDHMSVARASRLLKSIANESRLLILFKLSISPMTVGSLNEHIKISQSGLSQHLNMLKLANIVESRRNGTSVEYSLVSEEIKTIIKILQAFYVEAKSAPKKGAYVKESEKYLGLSLNEKEEFFSSKK